MFNYEVWIVEILNADGQWEATESFINFDLANARALSAKNDGQDVSIVHLSGTGTLIWNSRHGDGSN